MRVSQMGVRPQKTVAKDAESVNQKLLIQAAFIDQVMAGVYTYLPLGLRVLNKIAKVVREEMDKIGSEILMSTLAPLSAWEKTNRLDSMDILLKAVPANEAAKAKNESEYVIGPTHEEIVTPLVAKFNLSYKDLPVAVYQIQNKFRNEPRAKSGILRTREFLMKDLYSFHVSEEDFKDYYEKAKEAYKKVFDRLGIGRDTYIALASGGDFTREYSHEFQTTLPTGEDTIYLSKRTGVAYNKEVAPADAEDKNEYTSFRASEVGNIFPLGYKFSEAFGYNFTDKDGTKKPVFMGCYGIGISRLMGVIAEKFADDKGLVWPIEVAPFRVYLISFPESMDKAAEVYQKLTKAGVEVLWDDREASPGEKFTDADLTGIPYRAVVSPKSLAAGGMELKKRTETETKVLGEAELIKALS